MAVCLLCWPLGDNHLLISGTVELGAQALVRRHDSRPMLRIPNRLCAEDDGRIARAAAQDLVQSAGGSEVAHALSTTMAVRFPFGDHLFQAVLIADRRTGYDSDSL